MMLLVALPLSSVLFGGSLVNRASPLGMGLGATSQKQPQDPAELKDTLRSLGLARKLFVPKQAAVPEAESSVVTFTGLSGSSWQEMGLVRQLRVPAKDKMVKVRGVAWQEMGLVREVRVRAREEKGTVLDLPYQKKPTVVSLDKMIPALAPEVDRILAPKRVAKDVPIDLEAEDPQYLPVKRA